MGTGHFSSLSAKGPSVLTNGVLDNGINYINTSPDYGYSEQLTVEQLGVDMNKQGNDWRDEEWKTNVEGVFTACDMQHGQSLIVWAIAEGR